jgi:hypothetical protein
MMDLDLDTPVWDGIPRRVALLPGSVGCHDLAIELEEACARLPREWGDSTGANRIEERSARRSEP